MEILEFAEAFLESLVMIGILLFEFTGVAIIIITGLISIYKCIRRHRDTRLFLAKGLIMGLEFKLGSEILRTVVVREWKEIAIVGGIILLRGALTFLIHWEIRQEESAEALVQDKR